MFPCNTYCIGTEELNVRIFIFLMAMTIQLYSVLPRVVSAAAPDINSKWLNLATLLLMEVIFYFHGSKKTFMEAIFYFLHGGST